MMQKIITVLLSLSTIVVSGQGFSTSAINWNCPNGGDITAGITNGYNAMGGSAVSTDNTGSQSWSVMDMDGDGFMDLVVTAQLQGGNVTSFSPTSNQYWKVYTGNGSGFSTNAVNWGCPNGGMINGGITYGYNAPGGFALTTHNTGSQSWSVADMNNDGKPDLVVTAQLQGGNVTSFSPTSNQYWKVYVNTSTVGSVNIKNNDAGYLIFPNPATDKISIACNTADNTITGWEVYNIAGMLMEKREMNFSTGFIISLKNYNAGFYFIMVKDNNRAKVILQFVKE